MQNAYSKQEHDACYGEGTMILWLFYSFEDKRFTYKHINGRRLTKKEIGSTLRDILRFVNFSTIMQVQQI